VPTWAIIVAAGTGDRFGALKQFEPLGRRRVVDWSVATARDACDGVVLVVPASRLDVPEPSTDVVVAGGATRSSSVRAGLAAVPESAEVIVVHDAARPVASAGLWKAVVDAVGRGADAAVPVVPIRDTLREVAGSPVDRARIVAVQTPQAFRAEMLRRAHESGGEATDDATLVEAVGGRVVLVDGEPENLKITTPSDLVVVASLVNR
jgi:2-C-methyl-D-erythritol 4-phosphate cytidylyltransferase